MHPKVRLLSDHFVIQDLPLLDKNTDQLSSHLRCFSVLDYSLNKIHWGIQQIAYSFSSVNQLKRQYLSSDCSDKVIVMPRLLFPPFLETCFDPVLAIATFTVGTNFDSV